ncbi:MAG: AAA family ATPase [Lentisphaeria bacterium]|nr:AAA family ATPase [Lentisphaeria bacterium]
MASSNYPTLTIQYDNFRSENFLLDSPRVTIGSDPECNIVDTKNLLAPCHAEIQTRGKDFLITDCGAPDGCFINGNILEHSHVLRHNDVIQLGDMVIIFHVPAAGSDASVSGAARFDGAALKKLARRLEENIAKVFKGKPETIRNMLVCLLADGHLLLEDAPGVGKSVLAQALARSIFSRYRRIQFTPDMMPSDITGMNMYDNNSGSFRFVPGPIFGNVILADEINRTTPRTQSSLLECMSESAVTIDGETRILPKPFFVIATQNPEDYHGTYPLPEPQLDRFMMRLSIGYPDPGAELEILSGSRSGNMLNTISSVVRANDVVCAQSLVRQIEVSDAIKSYIIAIADATRKHEALVNGCSPRATLALMRACQSLAACEERDYVTPQDVTRLYEVVLAHRLSLKLRWKAQWKSVENVLADIVSRIKIPETNR